MFKLKKGQEAFTVVEGPFKNRKFEPGKTYAEIPPQEAGKFEGIKAAAPAQAKAAKPAKAEEATTAKNDDNAKAVVSQPSKRGGDKS